MGAPDDRRCGLLALLDPPSAAARRRTPHSTHGGHGACRHGSAPQGAATPAYQYASKMMSRHADRLRAITRHVGAPSSAVVAGWAEVKPWTYEHVPRLPAGSPELHAYMQEHGFAIAASVLPQAKVEKALEMIWDTIEARSDGKIDRNDASTWDAGPFGVDVHSEALWFVRGQPEVAAVWAGLLDVDVSELIVSYDGASLWKRGGDGGMGLHTDRAAVHSDSLENRIPVEPGDRPEYFQGFVNLLRSSEQTGGNVVVPGSHKLFKELAAEYCSEAKPMLDVGQVLADRPELFDRIVMGHMEPGDVFLWDDRTMHANAAGRGPGAKEVEFARAACYVTMSKKSLLSDEALETRRLGWQRGVGNGHPAHHPLPRSRFEGAKAGGKGWGAGVALTETGTPLNAFQRSLVPLE